MKHRFDQLRSQIWDTNDEAQIIALYEEAITIADRFLTEADAYNIRMDYTDKAVEIGEIDKLLVSFSWCWSKFLKNPERHSSFYIMWHFKWLVENLKDSSKYDWDQLDSLFELFKLQSKKHNYSLRPYYEAKMFFYLTTGRTKEAEQYYNLWRKEKRDGLSNCRACEQHAMGKYYFSKGHNKRGLQLLKSILDGKLTCRSVPNSTYEMLIFPLLELGRAEEAMSYANKSYRVQKGKRNLFDYGTLIAVFAEVNMTKATTLYRNTCQYVIDSKNDWDKLHYLVGTSYYIERRATKQKRRYKPLSNELDINWINAEIKRITLAFDQRNGNTYVSEAVDRLYKKYERLPYYFADLTK